MCSVALLAWFWEPRGTPLATLLGLFAYPGLSWACLGKFEIFVRLGFPRAPVDAAWSAGTPKRTTKGPQNGVPGLEICDLKCVVCMFRLFFLVGASLASLPVFSEYFGCKRVVGMLRLFLLMWVFLLSHRAFCLIVLVIGVPFVFLIVCIMPSVTK